MLILIDCGQALACCFLSLSVSNSDPFDKHGHNVLVHFGHVEEVDGLAQVLDELAVLPPHT
jgi:hypothetical protein